MSSWPVPMLMSLGDDLLLLILKLAIDSISSCKDYRSVCKRCKALLTGSNCHTELRDVWIDNMKFGPNRNKPLNWYTWIRIHIIPEYIQRVDVNVLCIYSDLELFQPTHFTRKLERSKLVTKLSHGRVYQLGGSDPYRLYIGVNKKLNEKRAKLWFKYQMQNNGFPMLLMRLPRWFRSDKPKYNSGLRFLKDVAEMCSNFYVFGKPLPIVCLMHTKPDETFEQFFKDHNITLRSEGLNKLREIEIRYY